MSIAIHKACLTRGSDNWLLLVGCAETDEINIFANSMRFLDVVLRSPVPQADDVVAGFIRFASDTFLGNENIKLEAARVLANMLSNDTRRLDGIIRRIR